MSKNMTDTESKDTTGAGLEGEKTGQKSRKRMGAAFLIMVLILAAAAVWVMSHTPSVNTDSETVNMAKSTYTVTVSVTDSQGRTESYTVPTDGGTVSDVISDAAGMGLIFAAGIDNISGQACVSAINGVKASGNAYWLCYVNGSYTEAGIDSISVQDGDVISFVWTKFAG